jgi:hypothetical protein
MNPSRGLLQKLGSARWPIAIGMLLGAVAYILMIYSGGDIYNNNYWRECSSFWSSGEMREY